MEKKKIIEWQKALRSGQYHQWWGGLKNDDCYCALGVLCDISGVDWVAEGSSDDEGKNLASLDGYLTHGTLPWPLTAEFEVMGTMPFKPVLVVDGGLYGSISGLNDDLGMTFDEIADFLDTFLDGERSFLKGSGE